MNRKLFSGDKYHHQNTYFICNKNKYSSKNNIAMTLTCTNVTLRQKPLRNDRISLYLDYYPAIRNPYTMKMSRREFLGIYIYAKPKNEQQRMFNQDMLNKAEAIRCIRVQSLINEEFGFLDKNKQKVDFLAYFRTKAREKYEKWDCVYNHFEKFVGGKCTFGDVTVELCEKFRDYLLKCKQINHPNAYISRNSALAIIQLSVPC